MSKALTTVRADRLEVNEIILRPTITPLSWNAKYKHNGITLVNSTIAKTAASHISRGLFVNKELDTGCTKYKWYYESQSTNETIFGLAYSGQDLGTDVGSYISQRLKLNAGDIVLLNLDEAFLTITHSSVGSCNRVYRFKIEDVGIVYPWVCSVPMHGFRLKLAADINAVLTSDSYGNFNVEANIFRNDNSDIDHVNLLKMGVKEHPGINTNTLNAVVRMSIDDHKETVDKLWSSHKIMESIRAIDYPQEIKDHITNKKLHIKIDDEELSKGMVWSSLKVKELLDKQDVSRKVYDHLNEPHCQINDECTSTTTTWSSEKVQTIIDKVDNHLEINSHLHNSRLHSVIDDTKVTNSSLWSSRKIADTLVGQETFFGHIDNEAVHFHIDDKSAPSAKHVWSSIKVANIIETYNNTKKVDNHIYDTSLHIKIDDDSSSTNSVWSSNKVMKEIETLNISDTVLKHEKNIDIHVPVNDSKLSNSNLWSSGKTNNVIIKKVADIIDDSHICGHKTWSSTKINTLVEESVLATINDSNRSKHSVWSSERVASHIEKHDYREHLEAHINNKQLHARIADDSVESTAIWSSEKTRSEINKITAGILDDQKTINIGVKKHLKQLDLQTIDPKKHLKFSTVVVDSIQTEQKIFEGQDLISKAYLDSFIYDYKTGKNVPKNLYVNGIRQDTNVAAYVQMTSGDVTYSGPVYNKDTHTILDNKSITNLTMSKILIHNINPIPDQTAGFVATISGLYRITVSICISSDNNTTKTSLLVLKNDNPLPTSAAASGIDDKLTPFNITTLVQLETNDTIKVGLKTQYLDSIIDFSHLVVSAERLLVNV